VPILTSPEQFFWLEIGNSSPEIAFVCLGRGPPAIAFRRMIFACAMAARAAREKE
jgi:hypothetical protein